MAGGMMRDTYWKGEAVAHTLVTGNYVMPVFASTFFPSGEHAEDTTYI